MTASIAHRPPGAPDAPVFVREEASEVETEPDEEDALARKFWVVVERVQVVIFTAKVQDAGGEFNPLAGEAAAKFQVDLGHEVAGYGFGVTTVLLPPPVELERGENAGRMIEKDLEFGLMQVRRRALL